MGSEAERRPVGPRNRSGKMHCLFRRLSTPDKARAPSGRTYLQAPRAAHTCSAIFAEPLSGQPVLRVFHATPPATPLDTYSAEPSRERIGLFGRLIRKVKANDLCTVISLETACRKRKIC